MKTARWIKAVVVAGLGLVIPMLTGCQTWVGGMTLPSGYYLDHPPQYFRKDPEFPLQKELATMQAQDALQNGGRAAEIPGR